MKLKTLISCGIVAAISYVIVNIVVPLIDPTYDWLSMAPSELSAIGAPTRNAWIVLCSVYSISFLAFAWGVWRAAGSSRPLRVAGIAMLLNGLLGFYWPPMHRREVIAAGGGTSTDTLHLVWVAVWGTLVIVAMVSSAFAFGRRFRLFVFAMLAVLVICGIETSQLAANLSAGLPTPWMGVWERVSILAFLIWQACFSWRLRSRLEN